MSYLLDTSILARLANSADFQHEVALEAVTELLKQNDQLFIAPQILVEFHNVATRPTENNGLGLDCTAAETLKEQYELLFPILPDVPRIFDVWKLIVHSHSVIGKQVHDARLVAVCLCHNIDHILTFNIRHFTRFATPANGLAIVDPKSVS